MSVRAELREACDRLTLAAGHDRWLQERIDLRDRAVRRAGYKWARRDDGEFELVRDREVTVKGDE